MRTRPLITTEQVREAARDSGQWWVQPKIFPCKQGKICYVDFLAKTRTGKLKLFQVAWDVENQETLDRETRALKQAELELGIKGLLVTPETYIKKMLVDT